MSHWNLLEELAELDQPFHTSAMRRWAFSGWIIFLLPFTAAMAAETDNITIRRVRQIEDRSRATIRVNAAQRSVYRIPANITGKFAEHLGANIYNGMDAQILRNPTFADYPFWTGQMSPDGVAKFQSDDEKIVQDLRREAVRWGWPETELDGLVHARADALACFWTREGPRQEVQPSPDTGPNGGRAQRVQVRAAGQGIAQWTWLPLHRIRKYEFEIFARSPDLNTLALTLGPRSAVATANETWIKGLSPEWHKFTGTLEVEPNGVVNKPYKLSIVTGAAGQFVIQRVLLRPADHVQGADPEVVRLLKQAHLPILRWPGGNFVSGYHWEDGIGSFERRPTKPNFAWGGVEPNLFGTDEFISFCHAVGCEPMICVNAGDGTPNEAARWLEYCNGSAESPMGRLRAANGHPEPFNVKHWEVGNELWGKWQYHWTTATGYVDRYKQFTAALLKADPAIRLYACGAPAMWGKQWNDTLIAGAAPLLQSITDHPLIGGTVPPSVEPLDVYRDFMAVPEVLEQKWTALRDAMTQAGVKAPHLAVTELQLFAHIGQATSTNTPVRLTRETLPSQGSITEAIYDILVYHAAVRLGPFVEMVTHSAVVNHGGGLRKERERVYANPCYYAQASFAAFANATPVAVDIESAVEPAPLVLPDLRNATRSASFSTVAALAAISSDGSLLVSIVNRDSSARIRLRLELDGFDAAERAEVNTLSAGAAWAANSLENPQAIVPKDSTAPVRANRIELDLEPFTVMRLRVPGK